MVVDLTCAPGCDNSPPGQLPTGPTTSAPGGSCVNPLFVSVCAPATSAPQVEISDVALGCALDGTGNPIGKVVLSKVRDENTGAETSTLVMYPYSGGAAVSPFVGAFGDCGEAAVTTVQACYNGATAASIHYVHGSPGSAPVAFVTDALGVIIPGATAANTTVGACVIPVLPVTESLSEVIVCAAGVQLTRKTVINSAGVQVITFTGSNGAAVAAPATYTVGECPVAVASPSQEKVFSGGANIAAGTFTASHDPLGIGSSWTWNPSAGSVLQSLTVTALEAGTPASPNNVRVRFGATGFEVRLLKGQSFTWSVAQDHSGVSEILESDIRVDCFGNSAANLIWTEQ